MRRDEERGRSDCLTMKAEAGPALANEEDQIMGEGKSAFSLYLSRLREERQSTSTELEKQQQRLESDLGSKRNAVVDEFDNKLDQIRGEFGPNSPTYQQLMRTRDDADAAYTHLETDLSRPLRSSFPKFYPYFMAALSIVELPINRSATDLLFAGSPLLSTIVALGAGVVLIYLAHTLGRTVRQYGHQPLTKDLIPLLLEITASILLIYILAIMRQRYVDLIDREGAHSFVTILRSGSLADVGRAALTFSIHGAGWWVLGLNAALFLVGFLTSFFHHDPHPDYEALFRRRKRAMVAFQAFELNYVRNQAALISERDRRLQTLEGESSKVEEQVSNLSKKLADMDKNLIEDRKVVSNVIAQRLRSYRKGFVPGSGLDWGKIDSERKIDEEKIDKWISEESST